MLCKAQTVKFPHQEISWNYGVFHSENIATISLRSIPKKSWDNKKEQALDKDATVMHQLRSEAF